jgi:hypothetical protein
MYTSVSGIARVHGDLAVEFAHYLQWHVCATENGRVLENACCNYFDRSSGLDGVNTGAEVMTEYSDDWWEMEAVKLIEHGRTDVDTVRELLILACHSSPIAKSYFAERLNHEALLKTLIILATEDYSGDAQMTASYWLSRFSKDLLVHHKAELAVIATNEWDSVAVHARRAIADLNTTLSD